jgi:hypothetical protein
MSASPIETTNITAFQGAVRDRPMIHGPAIINGQCHRYIEYELLPIHCTRRVRAALSGDHAVAADRSAATTIIAPLTGRSATQPGKFECLETTHMLAATTARPAQLRSDLARAVILLEDVTATATRPPDANSHALVGVAKKAIVGSFDVQSTDVANDPTAIVPRTRNSQLLSRAR